LFIYVYIIWVTSLIALRIQPVIYFYYLTKSGFPEADCWGTRNVS